MDGPEPIFLLDLQLDAFAQQAAQHLCQFARHIVQRQHLGLHGLLAAEGQQLADQGGGAQRVLVHLVQFLERGIARRMAHQQEFAIADDDGEQIVEVVRDAARQLAHGLHLLRLGELGFQRLLLGDVDKIEHHLAPRNRAGKKFGHAFAGCAQLHGLGVARTGAGDAFGNSGAIGRGYQIRKNAALQRGAAKELGEDLVGVEDGAAGIGEGDAHGRVAEKILAGQHRRGDAGRGRGGNGLRGRSRRGRSNRRRNDRHVAAGGQARHEPPAGLGVRQWPHGGDDLQPRHYLEAFLTGAAFGGVARQAIEHGGGRFARQRQFGRRRGFAFLHAGHAAIDLVAVDDGAAFAGDDPGDIGLARGFGDAAGRVHAARRARPHRDQQASRQHHDAEQKGIARPARQHWLGQRQSGGGQRHDDGPDGSPAPAAKRQADRGFGEGWASVHGTHSTGFG